MIFLNVIIFLFCIATVSSKAEKWYSAAIIDRRNTLYNSSNAEFRTNYIQNNEHPFLPLMLIDPKKSNERRTNFYSAQIFNMKSANSSSESDTVSINYNNTVENLNVLNIVRPKRTKIRKRCPVARPRQMNQLNTKQKPKTRFLEVFQVVEFDHVSCTSSSGLEGTCLPESECIDSGGSTMGTCADGYGTCCVSKYTESS